MKYTSLLNVQSCYNFLNSTIKIQDYIDFLKKNNIKVGFYTDLNTLYGLAEFNQLAINNDIKPILGVSFDLVFGRIIFLAKNNNGYKFISFLSSTIASEEYPNSEIIEKTMFEKTTDDVYAIFIPVVENYHAFKEKLQNKFKKDLFFGVTKKNYLWINKAEDNLIFAQEINYLYENDIFEYKTLQAIKEAKTLQEIEIIEKNFYLTNEQIIKYIDLQKHNNNLDFIIKNIETNIINDNKTHFVTFPNASNTNSKEYLKKICYNELKNLQTDINIEVYKQRLDMELTVINDMGFNDYFLIVSDLIKAAETKKILVGPGRGSAAGSITSYLLGITKLDPIKWGLLFERFLNIERTTMPDIDIDFQDDRRDEVLEYLKNKYGKNHFATITTFQTIGIKNAIRDCGRVFDIPVEDINSMAKQIKDGNIKNLEQALAESIKLQKYKEKYPQIFNVIEKIIGLPRQTGTHAAGVVFCDVDIHEVVPIKLGLNKIYQTQFPMDYLENIGLIKTDILGLRNLTTIQEVINNIKISKQEVIDLYKIPLNDKKTFNLLRNGDTSGIFQLESFGMTDVIKKMEVNSVDDIAITSSLYRPGPQENISVYIKRKNNKDKEYTIDQQLFEILNPTFGIIVYQEQVMMILQKVANFSLAKSDIVRRAISKKDQNLMNKFKSEFIAGAVQNQHHINYAQELWKYIEKFAEYGFNKSHAIAYSLISYWMAYLKANYKPEFYCALLNGVIGNSIKTNTYLNELRNSNYKINGPTIKNPNNVYFFANNQLWMPLNIIKGVGPEFLKIIKKIFLEDKKIFDSLLKLLSTLSAHGVANKFYDALVYAGAFDIYGFSRNTLITFKLEILNLAIVNQYDDAFDLNTLKNIKDNPEVIAEFEKEFLGFYLDNHPVAAIRTKLENKEKLFYISNLNKKDMICNILVKVDNIVTKIDKKGGKMCFLDVSDETGGISVTIFASLYDKIQNVISLNKCIIIKVKSQLYNDKITCLLEDLIKVIN